MGVYFLEKYPPFKNIILHNVQGFFAQFGEINELSINKDEKTFKSNFKVF